MMSAHPHGGRRPRVWDGLKRANLDAIERIFGVWPYAVRPAQVEPIRDGALELLRRLNGWPIITDGPGGCFTVEIGRVPLSETEVVDAMCVALETGEVVNLAEREVVVIAVSEGRGWRVGHFTVEEAAPVFEILERRPLGTRNWAA